MKKNDVDSGREALEPNNKDEENVKNCSSSSKKAVAPPKKMIVWNTTKK